MTPTTNTDIYLGLLTILMSFWMILWSVQNAPNFQKWAKIIGGLIILKVVVLMVWQCVANSCTLGCPLSQKNQMGQHMMQQKMMHQKNMMHQNMMGNKPPMMEQGQPSPMGQQPDLPPPPEKSDNN